MVSPGIQNGRVVTQPRMSCIKHPRGVKFCTSCWGAGRTWKSQREEVDSALGFPDTESGHGAPD